MNPSKKPCNSINPINASAKAQEEITMTTSNNSCNVINPTITLSANAQEVSPMFTTIKTDLGTIKIETSCSPALDNYFNDIVQKGFYRNCSIYKKTDSYIQLGSIYSSESERSFCTLNLSDKDLVLANPTTIETVAKFSNLIKPGAVFFVKNCYFNQIGTQIVIITKDTSFVNMKNLVYLGQIVKGLKVLEKFDNLETSIDGRLLERIKITSVTTNKVVDSSMFESIKPAKYTPFLSPRLVKLYEDYLNEKNPETEKALYLAALESDINIFLPMGVDILVGLRQANFAYDVLKEMYPSDTIDRIMNGIQTESDGIYANSLTTYALKHGPKWLTYDSTGYCGYMSLKKGLTPDRESYKKLMLSEIKRLYELNLYCVDSVYSLDINDYYKKSRNHFSM